MLRAVCNISWKDYPTKAFFYGSLPHISYRLAIAGHVTRHNEPAGRLLTWSPESPKRVGRPITLKMILKDDTGLEGQYIYGQQ